MQPGIDKKGRNEDQTEVCARCRDNGRLLLLGFAFAQTNNKMPWKTAIPGVLACFTTGLILYRARGAYPHKHMAIITDLTTAALPLAGIVLVATDTVAWPWCRCWRCGCTESVKGEAQPPV
jgi:hypothetical protein